MVIYVVLQFSQGDTEIKGLFADKADAVKTQSELQLYGDAKPYALFTIAEHWLAFPADLRRVSNQYS